MYEEGEVENINGPIHLRLAINMFYTHTHTNLLLKVEARTRA